MSYIFALLYALLTLLTVIILVRIVIEMVQSFARDWRPRGPMVVALEFVFTVSDPPINALRRIIPPLNLGRVSLDLSVIVLFLILAILRFVFVQLV